MPHGAVKLSIFWTSWFRYFIADQVPVAAFRVREVVSLYRRNDSLEARAVFPEVLPELGPLTKAVRNVER